MDRKDMPLLSVIVPVYNVESYLQRCVDSILNQTYGNFEVILVDDGSTDGSGAICDDYQRNDSRIKVIHKENGGLSSARNAGLEIMEGELLGFVDSDDYILENMYDRLYQLLLEYDADIAGCNFERRGPGGHVGYDVNDLARIEVLSQKECYSYLYQNKKVSYSVWNKLYKTKDFYRNYRFRDMLYEDKEATAKCFIEVSRFAYTGEPLYVYWENGASITRSKFSLGQFDALRARCLVLSVYEQIYPEYLKEIKVDYVMTGFALLRASYGKKEFSDNREGLYQHLRNYVGSNPGLPYTLKGRRNVTLLKIGLPAVDLACAIYCAMKKSKHCSDKKK